jgi:hypothetical protein
MRRSRGRVIDEPMEITPEIEALARRPYRMIVWHDEENGWAAEIPDLPGLSAAALAEGRLVPEPREELISTRR